MLNGYYVAKFEKVSLEQFKKDMKNDIGDKLILFKIAANYSDILKWNFDTLKLKNESDFDLFCEQIYERIKIPSRATYESAGYDFYMPFSIDLTKHDTIIIPTGIRCSMVPGYSLDIYPKSGLGFKHNLKIANTVGIIDSDYYSSSNEGHIKVKLDNAGFYSSSESGIVNLPEGKSFVQGIFHEVFFAANDEDNKDLKKRDGGFGSTN